MQPSLPVAPLNPWKRPSCPWARLHLDYAGPFEEKMILVVVDAHSKWIEAACTSSTSSASSIEVLCSLFSLPETVVTDNGTGFVSAEFEDFLKKNGIAHTTSTPYHPSSNGLAERACRLLRRALRK